MTLVNKLLYTEQCLIFFFLRLKIWFNQLIFLFKIHKEATELPCWAIPISQIFMEKTVGEKINKVFFKLVQYYYSIRGFDSFFYMNKKATFNWFFVQYRKQEKICSCCFVGKETCCKFYNEKFNCILFWESFFNSIKDGKFPTREDYLKDESSFFNCPFKLERIVNGDEI